MWFKLNELTAGTRALFFVTDNVEEKNKTIIRSLEARSAHRTLIRQPAVSEFFSDFL